MCVSTNILLLTVLRDKTRPYMIGKGDLGGIQTECSDSSPVECDFGCDFGMFCSPKLPPVAIFTCDPPSGISSLTVSFSAWDSYDSDGRIVSYEWNFGDGDTDTGLWAVHMYTVLVRVGDEG